MDHQKKTKTQLIKEIEYLTSRVQKLGRSLKAHEDECLRRVESLETSRAYIQAIIDNIGDPILVIDPDYRISLANKKVKAMAGGIDPVLTGLHCYEVSHHSKKPCRGKHDPCPLRKILKTKAPLILTHTHFDKDGNKMLVEINATPVLNKKGKVIHIIEACRDITERVKMEKALRESETRYRSLFEQSSDAIFILEADGRNAGKILSANKAACLMHGYTKKEILKLSITDLDTPGYAAKVPGRLKRILAGETLRFEIMHRKKDGTVFPVEAIASAMKLGDKKVILAIDRDISKRRQAEHERKQLIKELKLMSQTDGLTGLLNRQHMDKQLEDEIHRTKRYGNQLCLIMFDIDNFKKINDVYGHITGDKILKKAAAVVKETLRETDIAGRFGGDEFILILVQTGIDVGMRVAKRLLARIEKVQVRFKKEKPISFAVSMGICQYNDRLKNIEEFIAKVDKAMYMAKSRGHNQICVVKD